MDSLTKADNDNKKLAWSFWALKLNKWYKELPGLMHRAWFQILRFNQHINKKQNREYQSHNK